MENIACCILLRESIGIYATAVSVLFTAAKPIGKTTLTPTITVHIFGHIHSTTPKGDWFMHYLYSSYYTDRL